MLAHKPIRLHPDKPNNYNPIYEDDYVELGIRAMEVAATPPIVVNWAGSETVSVEDYCAYMGELVGVEPVFEYTSDAHTPLWPDVTYMHEVLGRTTVGWREGFRRMIEARHPEIVLCRYQDPEGIRCSYPVHRPTKSPKSWPPAVETSPHCSSPWLPVIPTERTPSTCGGTPSTTGPSSTGCPPCAPPCDWCRRRRVGPHAQRAGIATTPSTT